MKKKYYLLFFLSIIAIKNSFGATADHLVFTRVSTIPNESEAIAIYNPTQYAIPLNNLNDKNNPNRGAYFLTDGYVSDNSNQHYTNVAFINDGYKIYNEINFLNNPYCGLIGNLTFSNIPDSLFNIFLIDENDIEQNLSYYNKVNSDCTIIDECGLCNGPGIPEDLWPNLFDPFVTTKPKGSGLGLALVAKIINDHGGVIEFDSQETRTTFRVMLPITAIADSST